jgi:hypothetical protein
MSCLKTSSSLPERIVCKSQICNGPLANRSQDLTDILPLLKRGALVAQSPHHIEQIPGLDDAERTALREEVTHRFKHPRVLYLTITLCSIAAAIQGWDQEGANGANLSYPQQFGISNAATLPDGSVNVHAEKNQWILGFISSCPYIAIAFL